VCHTDCGPALPPSWSLLPFASGISEPEWIKSIPIPSLHFKHRALIIIRRLFNEDVRTNCRNESDVQIIMDAEREGIPEEQPLCRGVLEGAKLILTRGTKETQKKPTQNSRFCDHFINRVPSNTCQDTVLLRLTCSVSMLSTANQY
jgi:hypothetical protein